MIVVDKPAGLLTIATRTEKRKTAYAVLYDRVKSSKPPGKVFIVHRLDRDASGLLVFAKTATAQRRLQAQFKARTAGRVYLAVVEGSMRSDTQTLRSYMTETSALSVRSTPDPTRGRLAVTHLRVLRRSARTSLIEVRLETGRKHQVRAHLAEQGHPILGDRRYGSRLDPLRRLALHAARLRFRHPSTGAVLEFESRCPPSFRNLR